MKSERHQGKDLQYLTLVPDNYAPEVNYPLVIMLHGFGANMQDLAGLAPALESEGYVYACPNAPIAFDLGLGQVGYGWTPPRGEATPEDIRHAEGLLSGFFDEILAHFRISAGQALLMGFSQGGGMTYRCGLGRADVFAGLVCLSASLPEPDVLRGRLPQQRVQPIFIAHGRLGFHGVHGECQKHQKISGRGGVIARTTTNTTWGMKFPCRCSQDLMPWMTRVLPPWRSG